MEAYNNSGIQGNQPISLPYWPDKAIHRYISYRRELAQYYDEDPRAIALEKEIEAFEKAEEEKARIDVARIKRICDERIGTEEEPKEWIPIPPEAETLWEKEAYQEYKKWHTAYRRHLIPNRGAWVRRWFVGRDLLKIEEKQEARIQRLGAPYILKQRSFENAYERISTEEGKPLPTQDTLDTAWSEFELQGFYTFPQEEGKEARVIKTLPDGNIN